MYTVPVVNGNADTWGTVLNTQTFVEIYNDVASKIAKSVGTAAGDILTFSGSGVPSVLHSGAGNNGKYLSVAGGVPVWAASPTGGGGIGTGGAPSGWFDVTAAPYNADDTGVTDATIGIQHAIVDATNAGGGLVYIPPGIYTTGALNITNTVTVMGAGRGVSTLQLADNTNDYMFTYNGDPDEGIRFAVFSGFTLDCNGANQNDTHDGGGILANGAVQNIFENLAIHAAATWGLVFSPISPGNYGHNNIVNNCLFDNGKDLGNYGSGILTTGADENWFVSNDFEYLGGSRVILDDEGHRVPPACIRDTAGLNHIMASNFVNGGNDVIGVNIQDNDNSTRVFGSNFDGVDGTCILIVGSHHIITGNYFSGPGHEHVYGIGDTHAYGVEIGYASKYCVITSNTLITSAHNDQTGTLIKVTGDGDPRNNIITGNSLILGGTPFYGNLFDIAAYSCKVIHGNVGLPDAVFNEEKGETYTITANDRTVVMNATGETDVVMPAPTLLAGQTYTIKNISDSNLYVALAGGSIDGEIPSGSGYLMTSWESRTFVSNGSDWLVASSHIPPSSSIAGTTTANYAIPVTMDYLEANGTNITVTLPFALDVGNGKQLLIKNINSTNLTVTTQIGDNLDGRDAPATVIVPPWTTVVLESAGDDWWQLNRSRAADKTVTANYAITLGDRRVVTDGTALVANLPDPRTADDQMFIINNVNTSTATVKSTVYGQVNGADGSTGIPLEQWESKKFYSDGQDWWSLGFAH